MLLILTHAQTAEHALTLALWEQSYQANNPDTRIEKLKRVGFFEDPTRFNLWGPCLFHFRHGLEFYEIVLIQNCLQKSLDVVGVHTVDGGLILGVIVDAMLIPGTEDTKPVIVADT